MAKTKEMLIKEVADLEGKLASALAAALNIGNTKDADTAARIAELEKKLASATSIKDTFYAKSNDLDRELEMVHLVLDTLPSAPPREVKAPDAYSATKLTVLARFAGYLAVRP